MAIIYPIIAFLIVDKVPFDEYFTNAWQSFSDLFLHLSRLAMADILILACGWGGAIVAGLTINLLRRKGYQMF